MKRNDAEEMARILHERFVTDASGRATRIVSFRKFEPLVWTRVD